MQTIKENSLNDMLEHVKWIFGKKQTSTALVQAFANLQITSLEAMLSKNTNAYVSLFLTKYPQHMVKHVFDGVFFNGLH